MLSIKYWELELNKIYDKIPEILWDLGNFTLPLQIKVVRLNGQLK